MPGGLQGYRAKLLLLEVGQSHQPDVNKFDICCGAVCWLCGMNSLLAYQVGWPEVVTPLADTVRLIHCKAEQRTRLVRLLQAACTHQASSVHYCTHATPAISEHYGMQQPLRYPANTTNSCNQISL